MTTEIRYDLTSIPGFTDIINTGKTNSGSDYEKYYSLHPYSTKDDTTNYSIIRYNKEYLSSDLIPLYGLLRSIIVINVNASSNDNTSTNGEDSAIDGKDSAIDGEDNNSSKIVSFSPPKSIAATEFMTLYPIKTNYIVAEEFIEGTMINVFFNPTTSAWQIGTRNTVGADISFYTCSKTFKQMFTEACFNNNFDIRNLNRKFCYSFVLQHPENRIVVPFKNPQLYLVAVYHICQTKDTVIITEENLNKVRQSGFQVGNSVRFPDKYEFSSYTELIEKFASPNTPYDIMGIIVKNMETGQRTKFRNPIYEEVRHLRGNQPKLQYQYLCLRHSGKLPEFLKYYPETKDQMSLFRDQVHMFTNTLHKNYLSCYVKKEKSLKEFSDQYKTHMFKIHEQYINELRPKQLCVNNTVVIRYVNSLEPSLLMFSLNYNMRKRSVDTIKTQI